MLTNYINTTTGLFLGSLKMGSVKSVLSTNVQYKLDSFHFASIQWCLVCHKTYKAWHNRRASTAVGMCIHVTLTLKSTGKLNLKIYSTEINKLSIYILCI